MTRWVLADFGGVISYPLPAKTIGELADLAGQQAAEFLGRYWKFRPAYDLGQSDRAYWSAVLGDERRAEPELVETMVRVDIAGAMTLNPRTLPALIEFGTHPGVRLALLSNAPEPLASAIDESGWSARFDRRFYSCRLGLAKPDPAVYEAVLDDLGARPQSVLFIDDRAENVLAAAALGLQAVRFTSAEELPGQLERLASFEREQGGGIGGRRGAGIGGDGLL
jgi:putative hydrolase of the HAD superfamily